ncbi:hypothetical protein [Castellaniella denitrificans]|uniref:Uncharacterized protein n=1 Tax=Castellaniella denitrificans TaxID=56119 RepID=A0ABT4M6W8_9BURK|nr:hypothetical protein [Castellaniella denitrificans]MCZ4331068.1 hypothetical protein [Castellaniella denitrificans]
MKGKNITDVCKLFAYPMLSGFLGAGLFMLILNWARPFGMAPSDAVSVANTYIVFTTLIFTGFAVAVGVMGYLFTQQFTATKHAQLAEALEDLCRKIATEEQKGTKLLESLMGNDDVRQHLDEMLKSKVDALLRETAADWKDQASNAAAMAAVAEKFTGLDQGSVRPHPPGSVRQTAMMGIRRPPNGTGR